MTNSRRIIIKASQMQKSALKLPCNVKSQIRNVGRRRFGERSLDWHVEVPTRTFLCQPLRIQEMNQHPELLLVNGPKLARGNDRLSKALLQQRPPQPQPGHFGSPWLLQTTRTPVSASNSHQRQRSKCQKIPVEGFWMETVVP